MVKPLKLSFELTLDTKIEGSRTLGQWAKAMGIPETRAVDIADTFLSQGIWRAIPRIEIEFVKEVTTKPEAIEDQPKRRARRTKAQIALDEAEKAKAANGHDVQTIAAPAPKAKSVSGPDEITWDSRARSYGLMKRPWGEDWGPEPGQMGCLCPSEILAKYGVE